MRKIFIIILVSIIVSGAFCQSGTIRELTGVIELKPAGAASFVRASQGDEVAVNTIISSGFNSTAIIEVGNSIIIVRPLTRLSLAEIQVWIILRI